VLTHSRNKLSVLHSVADSILSKHALVQVLSKHATLHGHASNLQVSAHTQDTSTLYVVCPGKMSPV